MDNRRCTEGEVLMLDTAGKVWSKIQEFMKRINQLEDDSEDTKKEVNQLRREIAIIHKELDHGEKIATHQGKTIAEMERRIAKLERDKKGLAISAGIAKSKVEKMKRGQKQRH
jgi:septal ring factor EnvC (AmiA/AmiB activator)